MDPFNGGPSTSSNGIESRPKSIRKLWGQTDCYLDCGLFGLPQTSKPSRIHLKGYDVDKKKIGEGSYGTVCICVNKAGFRRAKSGIAFCCQPS